jgi:2-dehydro-3-deoxy-D-gluconate 5-dehydrogenase
MDSDGPLSKHTWEWEQVVIVDRAEDTESFANTLTSGSVSCHRVIADLLDRTALENAFDGSLKKLGGTLDILVNSAGIRLSAPAEHHPIGEWDRVIEINLTAIFLMCQLAGRAMLTRGRGSIINIAVSVASMAATMRLPMVPAKVVSTYQVTFK